MQIDEAAHAHRAGSSHCACAVEQSTNVLNAADVEVAADAPSWSHSAEQRRRDENELTVRTRRVEELVETEVVGRRRRRRH